MRCDDAAMRCMSMVNVIRRSIPNVFFLGYYFSYIDATIIIIPHSPPSPNNPDLRAGDTTGQFGGCEDMCTGCDTGKKSGE